MKHVFCELIASTHLPTQPCKGLGTDRTKRKVLPWLAVPQLGGLIAPSLREPTRNSPREVPLKPQPRNRPPAGARVRRRAQHRALRKCLRGRGNSAPLVAAAVSERSCITRPPAR
jgi:hypothetical protein